MWLHLAGGLLQFSVIILLVSFMQKRKNTETEKQTTDQIKVAVVLLVISALLALLDIIRVF
jgi:membrane-associated protease RseP (regulator of RpoE activity)